MSSVARVLVLMATYNGQEHLAEQLDSILNQEGVEVFVRISDDCSTDNTFRILETYASEHDNIEIIYNSTHQGKTRTIMQLVYDAPVEAYDYIALANQDDIWLSGKLAADELFVVDGFNFDKPSTKSAAKALEALGCKGRVTVVVNDEDVNSFLSFRNLEKVRVIGASESNTYDLLDNGSLVMTKDAVEYVQEVLS